MLFQRTILDVVDDVTSTSISTSSTTPTVSKSTLSLQTIYNSINSMSSPSSVEINSSTLTNDVPNDSSSKKLHDCQTEIANKSMTITTMIAANDFKMTFPMNFPKNTTKDSLLFPLKLSYAENLKQQNRLHEMSTTKSFIGIKENFPTSLLSSSTAIQQQKMPRLEKAPKKFPILKTNKINLQKTFPTKICEKPEIFKFQILRFPNDLNMPQATLEINSARKPPPTIPTTPTTTTRVKSPPKIITQSTNLAITAAIHGRNNNEHDQHQEQQQEKWQKAQVHCDHQERAIDNDDNDVIRMPEISKELTTKIITMDSKILKNENLYAESNQLCTHNNHDHRDEHDDDDDDDEYKQLVKEIAINGNTKNISLTKMPPFIYDDNDVYNIYNICNIESIIQLDDRIRPQYSDVRDTSSKEVLVDNIARGQCGKCRPLKAIENVDTAIVIATAKAQEKEKEKSPQSSSKSSYSPFYELTSNIVGERAVTATAIATATPSAITAYDKLPNFELLPNYYALELVESNEGNWTETKLDTWHDLVDYDNIKIENIYSDKKGNSVSENNNSTYKLPQAFRNEMTLTKLDKQHDDHDEATQTAVNSEPPSPVLSLNGGEQQDSNNTPSFHEMKFEMRSAKSAISSTTPEHHKPERRTSIVPTTAIGTTTMPTILAAIGSSPRDRPRGTPSGQGLPIHGRVGPTATTTTTLPKITALKNNYHTNVDNTVNSKTLLAHPENTPRSSIAATTRSSTKIGNDAIRNTENEVKRTISIDAVDSVLPERTRLRRQRRMASMGSIDKNEDPVERLNRLRARISGALSEVKGVLNKYSTETEPNETVNEPQPPKFVHKKYNPETELTTTKTANELTTQTQTNDQNTNTKTVIDSEPQNNNTKTELIEQNTTTEPHINAEKAKSDDGPVQFRFVRKVRRRSVFTEDEEDKNNEKETQLENSEEKKSKAVEPKQTDLQEKLIEPIVKLKEGEKEDKTLIEKVKELQINKDEKYEEDRKKKIEISEIDNKIQNENEASANKCAIEIPKININKSTTTSAGAPSLAQDEVNKDTKIKKNKLKIESKDTNRRASTGAIEEIEPIEALKVYKIKRRPSDTATIVKGRQTPAQHLKKEKVVEKYDNKAKEVMKIPTITNESESTTIPIITKESELPTIEINDLEKQNLITEEITATKDIKSTKKQISENNIKLKDATKSSKRPSLKRNDSGRRASIAAVVEKSKIMPVSDIKTQRRPSDSTTSIQTKDVDTTKILPPVAKPSLITRRPTPRVKAGAKVKRPSLKSSGTANDSATELTVVDETLMTTAAYANKHEKLNIEPLPIQSIKAINDATSKTSSLSSSVQAVQARTDLPTTLSTASLPTVIDNALTKVNSQKFVTSDDQSKAITLLEANIANSQTVELEREQVKDNINTGVKCENPIAISGKQDSQLKQRKEISNKNTIPAIIDDIKNSKESSLNVNHAKQTLPEKSSINLTAASISSATKIDDDNIKKPIHQQEKIPVLNEAPSTLPSQQIQCAQQVVAKAAVTATAAAAIDTAAVVVASVLDSVPNISKPITTATVEQSTTSEVKNSNKTATSTIAIACSSPISDATTATKAAEFAVECNSSAQTITTASITSTEAVEKEPPTTAEDKMPELQISPAPVKAVQIQPDQRKLAPFNLPKEEPPKKRIIFKKLVRQKSTEKSNVATATLTDTKSTKPLTATPSVEIPNELKTDNVESEEQAKIETETESEIQTLESCPVIEEAPPKKPRKVKKKVIIKRQQRRLSVSDQTFFNNEINTSNQEDEKPATQFDTLEKPIAYVTDDEEEEPQPPALPIKGCMRQREFQVGELIMYAERYKRTQVRWKKGQVLERITSISYKLDIDGKEVPAHISYIKRYTDRKVSFGGKEYLEIDYEQIAETEEKARSYSIWNMV